jgi:hypothetical protein
MTDLSKIDTTIYLGNFPIHQPVTAFTGILISCACLFFYVQLSFANKENKIAYYWKIFFINLTISTMLGAFTHAFFLSHEGVMYKTLWLPMQVLNGIAIYCAQQATMYSVMQDYKNTTRILWSRYSKVLLIVLVPAVFIFQNFLVSVINSALGLIPVMLMHFSDTNKKDNASKWIAYGILISFLTAIVHVGKIGVSKYFNHLDIAHILIIINLSVMYKGVKLKSV